MSTIELVLASAFSFLVLVVLVNLVLVLYARGVVRSALDEGVRAGAPSRLTAAQSVAACRAKAGEVLDGLLSGPLGSGVSVECRADADGFIRATAHARFEPWIPGSMPVWTFDPSASSRKDDR
jgi:hypothetical protein